jgi:group I intron endonuclease
MSSQRSGEKNSMFGKTHSEKSKEIIKQKALGRKHSFFFRWKKKHPCGVEETKLKMSAKHGNPVNVYEKCSSEGFKLIGSFVSARRAAKFLGMSHSTINRYVNSGAIFKDRYRFSSPLRGHPQPPLGGGRGIK